jgi:hypothetical protein
MLLGDVIANLEDETFADETLVALGDLALASRVAAAAAREAMSRGEFVSACVGRFATQASDEQWVTVLGQMGRTDLPGQVLLRHALTVALAAGSAGAVTSPQRGEGARFAREQE